MDFSNALALAKGGERIARKGWNGKGMWVAMSPGFTLTADRIVTPTIAREVGDGEGTFLPYLMIRTVDGMFVPWVISQSDVLAEDWAPVNTPEGGAP